MTSHSQKKGAQAQHFLIPSPLLLAAQAGCVLPQMKQEYCNNSRQTQQLPKDPLGLLTTGSQWGHCSLLTLGLGLPSPPSCGHQQGVPSQQGSDGSLIAPQTGDVLSPPRGQPGHQQGPVRAQQHKTHHYPKIAPPRL